MSIFTECEAQILDVMTQTVLTDEQRSKLKREATLVDYSSTPVGYFLTAQHRELPIKRTVCNKPSVTGESKGVATGFIVIVMDKQLTIECFAYDKEIPDGYRGSGVSVTF